MLSRFSVKRPFVIIVAVVIILILGVVSVTQMKVDLLPEMDMPYLAVITTDAGASAEKVESEVTDVLERELATISGVSSITSTSSDNYSSIFLEFEDDTDMDSALVKVSSAVNEVASQLPDTAGTPNYMEISMDMIATLYLAVASTDMDIYELSAFVNDTVAPALERVDGVSEVAVAGAVEQYIEVRLDQDKIDAVNDRLTAYVNEQIAQAESLLALAQQQLSEEQLAEIETQLAAMSELASIDSLISTSTIAALIAAQNFEMPAGYIDDENDDQWLLRIGETIGSVEELEDLVLISIDGVGDIRVSDVADVVLLDNSGATFARIDKDPGIILSVYKTSNASTSEVSSAVSARSAELEEQYPGLGFYTLSDQASYIDLFTGSILQSLVIGLILAVIILALFLLDVTPTLVVLISIPFSVLFAFVFMYIANISINVLTLGGIALAIGMLVDNSIVVLENIYRLRGRGISPARAAVQGAKQITGPVVASTLTTICVFLPMVFTTGMVNQLMVPFALTITFVLVASLLVSLTLVPTLARYMFRTYKEHRVVWFEHLQDAYGRALAFLLRHKAVPLIIVVALLAVAVGGVFNMGISFIPSMTNKTIMAEVMMPEDTDNETAIATVEDIMQVVVNVDGVGFAGMIDDESLMEALMSTGTAATEERTFSSFTFYIHVDDSVTSEKRVRTIADEIAELTSGFDCDISTNIASSESMTSLTSSGLTLTITGPDMDTLIAISDDVMDLVADVDGYIDISNGIGELSDEMTLVFDRDELARYGLTIAQVYAAVAGRMSTSTSATTLVLDGFNVSVTVVDDRDPLTAENLLDTVIDTSSEQIRLGDIATLEQGTASQSITHTDSVRTVEVTASVEEDKNNTVLSRELSGLLDGYELPSGYSIEFSGELESINDMLMQMGMLLIIGIVLVYLIMMAQFQSLLSPVIVILTVPLAFTGGLLALLISGRELDLLSLMGFLVLMGTVVNNGIVFVDYVNQLRRGGMEKRDALVAAGRTRMRPILMTALTTVFAMLPLMVSGATGSSMQRGMATVVVGGMIYAIFMTLFIVPILYDIFYRRVPKLVDLGDENINEDPGDAAVFLTQLAAERAAQEGEGATASGAVGEAPDSAGGQIQDSQRDG